MANQSVGPSASRIVKALRKLLCGSSLGQAAVEYTAVVGSCAVVCLAGANHYGRAVNADLRATAEHLEGRGMPDLVDLREALPQALADGDDRSDDDDDDEAGGGGRGGGGGRAGAGGGGGSGGLPDEERVCGVTGGYGELKKGALPHYSDGDTYSFDGDLKKRKFRHKYERDHIPAKDPLKIRARANTENRIAAGLLSRCPKLEPGDLSALTTSAADRLDWRKANAAVDNVGFTVVMPTEMHKKWSRTQGKKLPGDARNLAAAEVEDIESYRLWLEEYLAKDQVTDDHGTQFRDTRCAEQILAALDSFPAPKPGEDAHDFEARRNAEYDRMLNAAVDRALGSSAIDAAIEQAPLPGYCE